ncbi:magnesium-translocating P-type ATPase [Methanobrevibacter sp. TMH8]|uniref:magnesium-translocating P-type ATPase n=1 Tax=Methanobrevibacter sp. TMH8 TaxID=2848611 RepID=UPI001CCA048D|nr:magnesium-translocating P-type ATPase [Methanobrevibacter sp. TMH8]MBZ9570738.1 magnesium-translocating P-type ATPase [Methanobrevibacter sp. TMH8]
MKKITKSNKKIKNEQSEAAVRRLMRASKSNTEDVLKKYKTTSSGYDKAMVEKMRKRYGENTISHQEGDSLIKRIFKSFINPFTLILISLAIISFFTDFLIVSPADRDLTAVIIVLTMVVISGTLRFVQETRSNNSAKELASMVKITTAIERKGCGKIELPLEEVVVGDIIHLAAGDMIPADVRIISSKDLFLSQSSLTGESEPIEKLVEDDNLGKEGKTLFDTQNLAFMGSTVESGTAKCIVIAVGNETNFGSMAQTVTVKKDKTSFDKGLNSVSWLLIRFMAVMVPVIFFINGFTKGDWLEALLFGISIAVGLTPEMLPMIVTTNLAKGAVKMAKNNVIVKSLNTIQNFGAMDVLCTDKTGTLTQDKVVLELYLDIHGNEDDRILRHAFLNSYYQTGLKNLMDAAILDHVGEEEISPLTTKYTKVDEIPFDFNRRRMSVVIKDKSEKTQMITKGAVEEMLDISSVVEYKDKIEPLTDEIRNEILDTVTELNNKGMRVIAVAQKNHPSEVGIFSVADESEMCLMGYLAFLDPPKESAKEALETLKDNGVDVKILSGDNEAVTRSICNQVGIEHENVISGVDLEKMSDEEVSFVATNNNIFAKLSPNQKTMLVSHLREQDHVVGFLGDGINDAGAINESDVGISVDTAVDISKESADIILLQKDLMVLEQGVIEGRRTFGNIIKYIKMTASSNFGNMFSVLVASIFLPFLPMLPLQILMLNLIYDISCVSLPWDRVDEEYLKKPRKWDASSIGKFMIYIGPTSSVFDLTTYALMFFIICPAVLGGSYGTLGVSSVAFMALFNAGWFVESLWSQTLVIHALRTPKLPFIESRASSKVILITCLGIAVGTILPFTGVGAVLGMLPLPWFYFPWLIATMVGYMALATVMKKVFIKKFGELH